MNRTFSLLQTAVASILLLTTIAAKSQNYWDKIPTLTSQCYEEKDNFGKEIQQLQGQIKEKLETNKRAVEEKAGKMTEQEKMAIAMRYQKMTPQEIVKMQNEMMALTQLQSDHQQQASSIEERFNQLESDFRSEFEKNLGPIEQEYRKLPDGEGTPPWAIKKGEELMKQYNQSYESICAKYFTSSNALFKTWLKEYRDFLVQHEVPFNQKMLQHQYSQFGFTPDESSASLMAMEKYLGKCASIFGLRRPYPQG